MCLFVCVRDVTHARRAYDIYVYGYKHIIYTHIYIYRAWGMQATWVMQRARTHIYTYIYMYTNVIYICIYISIYIYIYRAWGMQATWVMQRARAHIYIYIYMYTNVIYICICLYICVYVYIYVYGMGNAGNVGDAKVRAHIYI